MYPNDCTTWRVPEAAQFRPTSEARVIIVPIYNQSPTDVEIHTHELGTLTYEEPTFQNAPVVRFWMFAKSG